MILRDEDAAIALTLLTMSPHAEAKEVVIYHTGQRYAGFRSRAHAEWFVRQMGWQGQATIIDAGTDRSPGP